MTTHRSMVITWKRDGKAQYYKPAEEIQGIGAPAVSFRHCTPRMEHARHYMVNSDGSPGMIETYHALANQAVMAGMEDMEILLIKTTTEMGPLLDADRADLPLPLLDALRKSALQRLTKTDVRILAVEKEYVFQKMQDSAS